MTGAPAAIYERVGNQAYARLLRENRPDADAQKRLREAIRSVAGAGRPLGPTVRTEFESRFDYDFGGVRVHDDAESTRLVRSLGARAFAIGGDLFFGSHEYSPRTDAGRSLLAHELAHTVQQSRGGPPPSADPTARHERQADDAAAAVRSGASAVRVEGATGVGVARQGHPPTSALTPEEMLEIITRERAFTFNRGGAPREDPRQEGRGVGPAAGGRSAGHAVFTVMQVTDANGRALAQSRGEHVQSQRGIFGAAHAEPRALRGLETTLRQVRESTIRGGRLVVVVDQLPCPPGQADCAGALRRFARRYGLGLDVFVPTRGHVRDPDTATRRVTPRTAVRGSQRTDLQAREHTRVRLRRVSELSFPPPSGSTPRGPTGGQNRPPPRRRTPRTRRSAPRGRRVRPPRLPGGGPAPVGRRMAERQATASRGIQLGLQGINWVLNQVNDYIQRQRMTEAWNEVEPTIARTQSRNPTHGVLVAFYYTQVSAPPDSAIQPGPAFSHIRTASGQTMDEAQAALAGRASIQPGVPRGARRQTQLVWLPPRRRAAVTALRTPFPAIALATFGAGRARLQHVAWGGVTGFDDEQELSLSVPADVRPRFLVLRVPSTISWFHGRMQSSSVPVTSRTAADGSSIPVVDLDPVLGWDVTAACVFPADRATDRLFGTTPATHDNLGQLRSYTNFRKARWVRPENVRVLRRL